MKRNFIFGGNQTSTFIVWLMLLSRSTEADCMFDWSAIFAAVLDLLLDRTVGAISKLAKMNEAATLRLSKRGFNCSRNIFRMLRDMLLNRVEEWLTFWTTARVKTWVALLDRVKISQLLLSFLLVG